jgi:hypothetical protein
MISQKTRQSLLFGIATVVIVLGTILTVLLAQGYRINPTTGAVYTTGLVITNTQPTGAKVFFNGTNTRTNTPARFESIEPGPLVIKYTRQNYRDWQTTKQVRAYEVVYADYALLVPDRIPYVKLNPAVSFGPTTQSNDKRTIFGVSSQNPSVWRVRNDFFEQIYSPSTTAPALSKLDGLVSSTSGDRLLLRQTTVDSATGSIIYLDTNSKNSTNLTAKFGPTLQDLRFAPGVNDQLYWLEATNLRRVSMPAQTASEVLARNIISYSLSKNNIITVEREPTGTASEDNIYRYDLDGSNRRLVYNLRTTATSYTLEFSKGQFNDYLYILNPDSHQIIVLRDPFGNSQIPSVIRNATGFSVSPTGRFLVVGDTRGGMRSFDLEFVSATRSQTQLPNPSGLYWYGDYQIVFERDGQSYIVDYDGSNLQQLSETGSKTNQVYPYILGKGFYIINDKGQIQMGKFEAKN